MSIRAGVFCAAAALVLPDPASAQARTAKPAALEGRLDQIELRLERIEQALAGPVTPPASGEVQVTGPIGVTLDRCEQPGPDIQCRLRVVNTAAGTIPVTVWSGRAILPDGTELAHRGLVFGAMDKGGYEVERELPQGVPTSLVLRFVPAQPQDWPASATFGLSLSYRLPGAERAAPRDELLFRNVMIIPTP